MRHARSLHGAGKTFGAFQSVCWDCKWGIYKQRKNGVKRCRGVHSHDACDWRVDPRLAEEGVGVGIGASVRVVFDGSNQRQSKWYPGVITQVDRSRPVDERPAAH